MASSSKVVDWQKLREFADVDLERSFVLSWNYEAGALLVDIDLLLLPEHPFYEKPRPAEKVCIRPALIEFPFCQAVTTGKGDDDIAAIVASLENRCDHGFAAPCRRVLRDQRCFRQCRDRSRAAFAAVEESLIPYAIGWEVQDEQ